MKSALYLIFAINSGAFVWLNLKKSGGRRAIIKKRLT
jgi:hypothetical protein